MKLKNLLPLLAIICSFAACSRDENGNDGPLFKEPCVQWGASKSTVKSYMKGYTLVDDEVEYEVSYMDIKTRNLLPYTVMYDYSFWDVVYNPETNTYEEVNKGLEDVSVLVMGTTKQQQENLNEEIVAFFNEKYNKASLPPFDSDSSIYYEDGTYKFADEEEGDEGEIIGAYANDEKTVYIVVAIYKKLDGATVNNWIVAFYSYDMSDY